MPPTDPGTIGDILKWSIVGASIAAVLLTFGMALQLFLEYRRGRRAAALAWLGRQVGVIVVIGLITEAVAMAPFITPAWRSWVYLGGLALYDAGTLYLAMHWHEVRPRFNEGGNDAGA